MRDDLERELTELSLFKLAKRYGRLGIMLDEFTEWKAIREIQFTRNAGEHGKARLGVVQAHSNAELSALFARVLMH